jgi:mannose-6-phosphate isomerase-like protein (cupin superfamily)
MYELYKLPQGKIVFAQSSKELNIGALYLNPQQALAKHNRSVTEQLIQVVGSCVMKLFDGDTLVKEVTLHENDTLTIPANQFHMHTNPTDQLSVTIWKFEGDISEVLQGIRDNNKKLV